MAIRDKIKKSKEEEKATPKGLRSEIKDLNKGTRKKERFLRVRMWISYFISMTMKDRGKIPDNIGDRILITNNLYITKLYMTSIIQVQELGSNTPITLVSILCGLLRDKGNTCILDVTLKNKRYSYDKKNSGLQSRIRGWENVVASGSPTKRLTARAAACLYTVSVAEAGKQLKETRLYLSIRGKKATEVTSAEKIIYTALGSMNCTYLPMYSNVKETMEYISIIGNHKPDLKTIPPVLTSNEVMSQIIPNCGSTNDKQGLNCGVNLENGNTYYLDTDYITMARNIYICAPSGVGKTVFALGLAMSAFENGNAVCITDIKGNEATNFINATGGHIVSLRPFSIEYINSFVMNKSDCPDEDRADLYFKSRINFSKQQIIILSGIRDRAILLEFEELLDEFLESLYIHMGVASNNLNSWIHTKDIHPYDVYDRLNTYMTPHIMANYNISKSVMGVLKMYMSRGGSKSYVFKREFEYKSILEAPTLSFDFGLLGNTDSSDTDEDLFRLKFLYMSKLNSDFVTKKYAEGKRTLKLLEESQVVSDEVMAMYVKEYTLRRAQLQDTILIGNSVQALMDSEIAKPIIENTTGLLVGELTKDARDKVVSEFGLQHLEEYLKIPGTTPKYKNSFVFVNNMQSKTIYPILQMVMDPILKSSGIKPKVYTPVKEYSTISGK